MISLNCSITQVVPFVAFWAYRLEVGGSVDWTRIVILIQRILEWAVVCGGAVLLVVGIRIVEVVLISTVLLLAVDAPYRDSNPSKQDSATNTTNHTTNYTLGRTA